jgi:hypothetical protein
MFRQRLRSRANTLTRSLTASKLKPHYTYFSLLPYSVLLRIFDHCTPTVMGKFIGIDDDVQSILNSSGFLQHQAEKYCISVPKNFNNFRRTYKQSATAKCCAAIRRFDQDTVELLSTKRTCNMKKCIREAIKTNNEDAFLHLRYALYLDDAEVLSMHTLAADSSSFQVLSLIEADMNISLKDSKSVIVMSFALNHVGF